MSKRKPYTGPKPVRVPMLAMAYGAADHDQRALALHAAVLTMIACPSAEACNNLTKQLASLTVALSIKDGGGINKNGQFGHVFIQLRSAIAAIEGIIDRKARTGILGVASPEADTLRAAAQVLDPSLGLIPPGLYAIAEKLTEREVERMAA